MTTYNNNSREEGFWLPPDINYRQVWLCLYEDDEGRLIGLPGERYMCASSYTRFDPKVEKNMKEAAKTFGIEGGRPIWVKGRKVTDMEADDQMERLLDGKIPDEQEAVLEFLENTWLEKNHEIP